MVNRLACHKLPFESLHQLGLLVVLSTRGLLERGESSFQFVSLAQKQASLGVLALQLAFQHWNGVNGLDFQGQQRSLKKGVVGRYKFFIVHFYCYFRQVCLFVSSDQRTRSMDYLSLLFRLRAHQFRTYNFSKKIEVGSDTGKL